MKEQEAANKNQGNIKENSKKDKRLKFLDRFILVLLF